MPSHIAIAVSGGVDSLMAAFLLKEAGHSVLGIHFTTGFERHEPPGDGDDPICEENGLGDPPPPQVKPLKSLI